MVLVFAGDLRRAGGVKPTGIQESLGANVAVMYLFNLHQGTGPCMG